jgi:hypothetical protein
MEGSMSVIIDIKNKLEILPGNVLRVPGCEPVSSFTSLALAANVDCNASIITLEDAVNAIRAEGFEPRIIKALKPSGVPGTGKFLELPDGPSPNGSQCPCNDVTDWYQILKDNATPIDDFEDVNREDDPLRTCNGFNYSGIRINSEPFKDAPDPSVRPNTTPLGGIPGRSL